MIKFIFYAWLVRGDFILSQLMLTNTMDILKKRKVERQLWEDRSRNKKKMQEWMQPAKKPRIRTKKTGKWALVLVPDWGAQTRTSHEIRAREKRESRFVQHLTRWSTLFWVQPSAIRDWRQFDRSSGFTRLKIQSPIMWMVWIFNPQKGGWRRGGADDDVCRCSWLYHPSREQRD